MFWQDLSWQEWLLIGAVVVPATAYLHKVGSSRYQYVAQLIRSDQPGDRETFAATLRNRAKAISEGDAYQQGLDTGLGWLDRIIGTPFSHRSFHWSVTLAVAYPIAATLVVWAFTGHNSSGIAGLLNDDTPWLQRLVVIAALLAAGFFFSLSLRRNGFRRVAFMVIGFVSVGLLQFNGAVVGAVAVAVLVAVAVAGVGAVAGVDAVAVLFAVAVAVVGALIVAIAVVPAFTTAVEWLERRSDNGSRVLLVVGWLGLTVGCLVIPSILAGSPSWRPSFQGALIIFMALLPLANAVFDWASTGATRCLLRLGLGRRWLRQRRFGLLLFGLDLVLAFVLLIGLTAALWLVLGTFNEAALAGGGTAQIDLNSLVQRLAADPWQPDLLWVHLMIYSTLLPTVLHAAWALVSLRAFPYRPDKLKRYADVLEGQDPSCKESERIAVITYLAFWQYTPIIIVTIACAFVFYLFYRYLGIVPTMAQFAVDWGLAG